MKVLVMRFSSFGDVLQTLSVVGCLGEAFPAAEIHWVTRAEYADLIGTHPRLARVWTLPQGGGARALAQLGRALAQENFTHVYDAHNNLRSRLLGWRLQGVFGWRRWTKRLRFLRRPIYRVKRFLLFRFHVNLFPKPFSGQSALLAPLANWGINPEAPSAPQLFLHAHDRAKARALIPYKDFVALAPSAAFALKRWPLEHFAALIKQETRTNFVLLGGPSDTFIAELTAVDPARTLNLAGQLSLGESSAAVGLARALVANDTGLMHVAEQLGVPCVALMGPAPFGFPSRPATRILEIHLPCRPCSKHGQGPCVNPNFHQCLRDIPPGAVSAALKGFDHA